MSKKVDMKKNIVKNGELAKPLRFLVTLTIFWLIADQVIKALQRNLMELGQSIPIIDSVFYLTSTTNTGAAFSLLEGKRWLFLALAVLVIVLLITFLWAERPRNFYPLLGFGLLLAGSIGNFIDRVFFGHVYDLFDFRLINFAVFNIADIGITLGALSLLVWIVVFDGYRFSESNEASEK